MGLTLVVAEHPLLEIGAFATRFAQPLAELVTPMAITALVAPGPEPRAISDSERTPLASVRWLAPSPAEVRNLLRHGGFKPAGRSKPASEYLQAAHAEGRFPRINAAVDACNVASLVSVLPISLVDLDRVSGELSVRTCPAGTTYVFNPSGQVIDASGLLAVFDAEGPTGTPVKDAQRTKTHDGTRNTLAIIWGTRALPGRTAETTRYYQDLVAQIPGATNEPVELA